MQSARVIRASPRGGGFTLVEMLLVVLIIGVMVSGMVVSLRGRPEERLLDSSARDFAAALRYGRQQAAATGRPHRLAFDAAGQRYWIESWSADRQRFEPVRGAAGQPHELGAGVSLQGLPERVGISEAGDGVTLTLDADAFSGSLFIATPGQAPRRIDLLAGSTQVHESP